MADILNEQTELKRLHAKYANSISLTEANMAKQMGEITEVLKEEQYSNCCRLYENVFVHIYLQKILNNDADWYTAWCKVAGSPLKPVILVDPQDNPVRIIPPLLSSMKLTDNSNSLPLREYGGRIAMLIENGNAHNARGIGGQMAIGMEQTLSPENQTLLDEWMTVIDYYRTIMNGGTEEDTKQALQNLDDDLDL